MLRIAPLSVEPILFLIEVQPGVCVVGDLLLPIAAFQILGYKTPVQFLADFTAVVDRRRMPLRFIAMMQASRSNSIHQWM